MKTLSKRAGWLVVSFLMLAMPTVAADAPKVLSVIAVKVKGDQSAYLQKVKQLDAIQKRLETGSTLRVWRATAAGPNTGTIYVGIEYPSLEAYAKAATKLQTDEESIKFLKELDASGIREVISNSLLVEVTP
jgi:hypothetical protein